MLAYADNMRPGIVMHVGSVSMIIEVWHQMSLQDLTPAALAIQGAIDGHKL